MDPLDAEVRALVGRLNNLHEIFRVQGEILSYGEATVEPLTELLLSPPSTFPEPRVAAAECLGVIGGDTAVDALIRVLDYYDLRDLGPVQRLAEETVRNAAARRLTRFRRPQVIDALLSSLRRDHLIGAGQALARLEDTRAIPYLIECLEDDYKKEKAMEALRQFDQAAVAYLCEAVERPRFVAGAEPPLSQERRSRAAELLGELKIQSAASVLKSGLCDDSNQVRLACAVSLVRIDGAKAVETIPQLITGLEDPDLLVRSNCEEALSKIGSCAVSLLARAAAGEPIERPSGEQAQITSRGRTTAIKLLGNIRDNECFRCLSSLVRDAEELIRYRSVAALKNFSGEDANALLEQVARGDRSKQVRVTARAILEERHIKTSAKILVHKLPQMTYRILSAFLRRYGSRINSPKNTLADTRVAISWGREIRAAHPKAKSDDKE